METFTQILNRLDQEHPNLSKVTKKDLWVKWLSGERMPTHKQMMKIIRTISDSPYKIQIWQRVLLTTILGEREKFTYDDIYLFDIHPMACPRPRFTKYGRTYMPPKYGLFKKEIIRQIQKKKIQKYPHFVHMDVEFWFFSENKAWGWHIQKPDIDNLEKSILDSFQDAGIIQDDSMVPTLRGAKFWAYEPKIIVKIRKG